MKSDINTLVAQINSSVIDLLGALVTRWMAYIQIFDFKIKHILNEKNQAADVLSKKPITQENINERDMEGDLNDQIDIQLSSFKLYLVSIRGEYGEDVDLDQKFQLGAKINGEGVSDQLILAPSYSKESQMIATFLINKIKRLDNILSKA